MKEKTLSEKRRDLFSQRIKIYEDAIMKAENKETELWYNYLCVQLETIRRLVEEQDKQFIKEILDEIDYEMEDTADEKVSDETKSVLKVLKFKIKQKSGFKELK